MARNAVSEFSIFSFPHPVAILGPKSPRRYHYAALVMSLCLELVHSAMEERKRRRVRGFGSTVDTPCDLDWWARMERKYGRDLNKEERERTNPNSNDFIGFFGGTGCGRRFAPALARRAMKR